MMTFKQRLAEAGELLVAHLKYKRIVLANQDKALRTALRHRARYNKQAREEYVKMKAQSLTT